MNRIKFLILTLCAGAIVFYGISLISPNKPDKQKLFIVEDVSSKMMTDRTEEFTSAVLVNLDSDLDKEIFISGFGVENLFLKRVKDKFYPLKIPALTDPKGLTIAVSPCDIDQDGRDEIFILNKPSEDGSSVSKIFKSEKNKWIEYPISPKVLTELKTGYTATCIDRKGNRKYGIAIASEDGKHIYLEKVDSEIVNIADQIGMDLSSKGRSILGIPSSSGRINIFLGNEDGPNFYFANNGDGTFKEIAKEAGLDDPLYDARGISIIDANYDEFPDLVYGNMEGPTRLLIQMKEGAFKDITPEPMKVASSVNTVVAGDFNLDGYEDIYLNNIRGYNKTYANFENEWHELDIEVFAEKHMFGTSSLAADLDKDGSYEILNAHGDGAEFPITLYTIKPLHRWIEYSIRYKNGGTPKGATVILHTSRGKQTRVLHSGSGRYGNYDYDILFGLKKDESIIKLAVKLPSGKTFEFKEGNIPAHRIPIVLP